MTPKTFVMDTSSLLSAGKKALFSFEGDNVVIPLVVVRELESKRNDPDLGYPARSVLKALDDLREVGDLREGVQLSNGTVVRVEVNHINEVPDSLKSYPSNDTRIVTVAKAVGGTLVSKDLPLKIVASLVGVKSIDFVPKDIQNDHIDNTAIHYVSGELIDAAHENGFVRLDLDVPRNAGVILRAFDDDGKTALVIAKEQYVFQKVKQHTVSGISSKSAEQNLALNYLMDESIKIVSLGGKAGTGKTTLALAAGVDQVLKNKYKKITVFRSMHAVGGEELGFLPGTEAEKLDPWTAAIYDSLESFLEKRTIDLLKQKGQIEVLPLTHIRGRNLKSRFIIVDESQNLEKSTIMTALSRAGEGTKSVMTWDVSQRDNRFVGRHNGVYEVSSRLLGEKLFAHTSLQKSERSDVAELVSRKLDDYEL